ncbi:MAG TPA: hypothetical protein VK162_19580 [Streptosporangiaceae bacterium]|nr:hypothetical protein [Streptosporangiaceae bacterium]
MLVAAAVCPHPPLLIPAATGAAGTTGNGLASSRRAGSRPAGAGHDGAGHDGAAELRELRTACGAAVSALLAAGPDLLAMVGGAPENAVYAGPAAGSLRDFGIPLTVGSGCPVLPLSLTVGSWLLEQAGSDRPGDRRPPGRDRRCGAARYRLQLRAVAADLPPADCLRLGAEIAAQAPRVALLAMGDASARKAIGVHGAADPVAERYDAEVAAALAAADPARLASLDPALDDELIIAGRAAWQVLAGAADGAALRGQLRCAVAPYGVSYLVASWEAGQPQPAALAE